MVFEKSLEALKAAEAALVADLEKLWVPWDGAAGAVYSHHAAAGALQDAVASVTLARATLESREPVVPAPTEAPAETPAETPAEIPAETPTEAPEAPAEETPEEVTVDA